MKKWIWIAALCAVAILAIALVAGGAEQKTLTGQGKGYGGTITATVRTENGKLIAISFDGPDETPAIGGEALKKLPEKFVSAGSADIDVISGATLTSRGAIAAVQNAMEPEKYPFAQSGTKQTQAPAAIKADQAYLGFGISNSGRVGPGKDDTGTQVYSINQVLAYALFDAQGRILFLDVDQVEVATPNYDGEDMPHFSGFPGQSYNYDENHDEKVDSTLTVTEESFLAEAAAFKTKRERGDAYRLSTATWTQEMDKFQEVLTGKTVDEAEEWFKKYCSDRNGRPLKANATDEKDKAKYDALSDEEKQMLADVTSTATMSLSDSHGDILAAIRNAYENRRAIAASAVSFGTAMLSAGRVSGKDDKDKGIFGLNEVYAIVFFDENGKITDSQFDQMEVSTPNASGADTPHFSGYPGQGGWNYDENHDGTVDAVMDLTDDGFLAQVSEWKTKRERGDSYKMPSGTWAEQMDAFQKVFLGKTAGEVEEWYKKYCSDQSGRPLKADTADEKDKAKYDALSDDEKKTLADVTTTATMSVSNNQGDLIGALKKAYDNRRDILLNAAQ